MTMAPEMLVARFDGFDCEIDGTSYQGILSPLARAIQGSQDIVALLAGSPAEGDQLLAELVAQTREQIESASGPFNYIIAGAEPCYSTPMQYGGHFLELDRELIGARRPAITLIGGPETYIDVVSDLAETFLLWNSATITEDPQEVAKMTRATIITDVTNFPTLELGGTK